MKRFTCSASRLAASLGGKVILAVAIIAAAAVIAAPPAWWVQRGVTTDAPANDFAAANLGQLKHFASKAREELAIRLPGGAGPDIDALIASWHTAPPAGVIRDDYAPVTLGQLKTVAKPFYDRLIAIGYTNAYPWRGNADDFAAANLGQIKHVFHFDLTEFDTTTLDADGDGLPDWWEANHGLSPFNAADANDDSDGDGLANAEEYTSGTNPRSADTDGDGLTDSYEIALGTGPAVADTDGDGLSDSEELAIGTNPLLADTDGDGVNDHDDEFPTNPNASERLAIRRYVTVDLSKIVGTMLNYQGVSVVQAGLDDQGAIGVVWDRVDDPGNFHTGVIFEGSLSKVRSMPRHQSFPAGWIDIGITCPTGNGLVGADADYYEPSPEGANVQVHYYLESKLLPSQAPPLMWESPVGREFAPSRIFITDTGFSYTTIYTNWTNITFDGTKVNGLKYPERSENGEHQLRPIFVPLLAGGNAIYGYVEDELFSLARIKSGGELESLVHSWPVVHAGWGGWCFAFVNPAVTPAPLTEISASTTAPIWIDDGSAINFYDLLPEKYRRQVRFTSAEQYYQEKCAINSKGDLVFNAQIIDATTASGWRNATLLLIQETPAERKLVEVILPGSGWLTRDGRSFNGNQMIIRGNDLLLPVEVNCPEIYMFSGHKNDVVELCKVAGITCEWKLKTATPAIGTFDHPTDTACSFTATAAGKNTIQLLIGGKVAWEKPIEVLNVVSRAGWGAYAADTAKLATTPTLNGVTFHHSSNTADGAAEVLRIQDMHMQRSVIYWSRPGDGWGDIGYHFLMDKAGTVYQGRELEAAPGKIDGPYTLGSHVENNNTAAGIGICVLGDYEGAEAFLAARQEALEKAITAIARRYKLPASTVSYHKARATTNPTECPGSNVIPKAADIIKNVRRNLE